MKNILIYTGPQKKFNPEHEILAQIQIDNSLDLGWKKEDLLLVTDFPYVYNGVQSLIVPDGLYYNFDPNANKVPVIVYLLNRRLIDPKTLYWCHDWDAYQNNLFTESELELENFNLGLTHYTYKPEWQFGSFFFRQSAKDIFELLDTTTRARPHLSRNNEKTLTWLIKHQKISSSRYKRLNVTYNIMGKYLPTIYQVAKKPLKVLHFLPSNALEMFMYGKNSLRIPLMSDRLIKIFTYHGIQ